MWPFKAYQLDDILIQNTQMDQSPLPSSLKAAINPQKVQDMSQFEVICRVRPLQAPESASDIILNEDKPTIIITEQAKNVSKQFTFHKIYKQSITQGTFTEELANSIFENCRINGKGSLVLSYGVTNSGKTYTILGTENEPGLLPIIIERALREFPNERLKVTAIEAYNDQFYSLENKMKLLPKELYGTYQFDDYQPEVITLQSIRETLQQYLRNRSQADTRANKNSSRSHAIFKIDCDSISVAIVDLAGSERLNKASTNVHQTTSINTSLLVLGRCIHAFRDHNVVPYRESKLTKALAEYFNSLYKIFMVAHINRSGDMFHQNVNVLEYAAVSMTVKHLNAQMNRSIMKSARKRSMLAKSCLKSHQVEKDNQVMKKIEEVEKTGPGKKKTKKVEIDEDPLDKLIQEDLHRKKRMAMEIYVSQMIARMEDFDYYLDREFESQDQRDKQFIEEMRNARYESPGKGQKILREMAEAETRIKIRKEILDEIEKEKMSLQVECCTEIGPSMRKCLEESIRRNPPQNNIQTSDQENEEKVQTPMKNEQDGNSQSVLQKIWTHSKTVIKSTSKAIEQVVISLRDLSRKKERCNSVQKRKPNLSIQNQQVNEAFQHKRTESEKRKSMSDFIRLLDKVDKTSEDSGEQTSFLLDSLNSSHDENGNQIHFNHENKPASFLKQIRQSEEFLDKKNSPFFKQTSGIVENIEIKKQEEKESTFDSSGSQSNGLSHHLFANKPKKINNFSESSSQAGFLTENEDSKKSNKSKGKKPMKFKILPKPTVSPLKTRHQRLVSNTQKNMRIA